MLNISRETLVLYASPCLKFVLISWLHFVDPFARCGTHVAYSKLCLQLNRSFIGGIHLPRCSRHSTSMTRPLPLYDAYWGISHSEDYDNFRWIKRFGIQICDVHVKKLATTTFISLFPIIYHQLSTMLQSVSTFIRPALCQPTKAAAGKYAGTVVWRISQHRPCSLLRASFKGIIPVVSTVLCH